MKKRVYKIKDTITGEYITLGSFSRRASWMTFPHEAIRINSSILKNHVVESFELTKSGTYNLKGEPQ